MSQKYYKCGQITCSVNYSVEYPTELREISRRHKAASNKRTPLELRPFAVPKPLSPRHVPNGKFLLCTFFFCLPLVIPSFYISEVFNFSYGTLSMSLQPPRRRNGRPQACEPCRKRKIACDHTLPVCQRCKRRKTASACAYLAAPMTQKPDVEPELPNLSSLPALDIASPALTRASIHSGSSPPNAASHAILTNSSVFFGPTSFSAVFHENQENLGPVQNGDVVSATDSALEQKTGVENDALDAHLVGLGRKVLSRLPDQQTCNLLLERHVHQNDNDGWFKPATQYCSDTLWSTYGTYLIGSKSTTEIETVSRILCQNARTNLQEPDDPQEWLDSFTGPNLRWEALGLLLSACCYGAMSSPESESFTGQDGRRRENKQFVRETKECISICVTLCSHTDFVNPIMVALLYNNNLLLSVLGVGGDTSKL
jgi:hypothetical protein